MYKPVKKFQWLTPFKTLSESMDMNHFEKGKGKSFDSAGVSLSSGKYHPVNLFQCGILAYDLYTQTGTEAYRQRCIDQFSYFLDTARYTTRADGSIGFPYHISWRDLKPLWYSGLAQAEGIMYLIRYYALTRDQRAIPLIHRIRAFMLAPVDSGGSLNIISDKELWIEEYVGSKRKPQVINGFVTAIIGLHEYCQMFPDDRESREVLDKCLYTHKSWLHKYDTGKGILYDMGERPVVNPWYSKFQVIQMKQLYEFFGDTFYHDTEMRWAAYAYGKKVTNVEGSLLNDTNFSVPALQDPGGWYIPARNHRSAMTGADVAFIHLPEKMIPTNKVFAADGNESTIFVARNSDSLRKAPFIHVTLKRKVRTDAFMLLTVMEDLDYSGYRFYVRPGTNGKWQEVTITTLNNSKNRYYFGFDEQEVMEYKLELGQMNRTAALGVYELSLYTSHNSGIAYYSHAETEAHELADSTETTFALKARETSDFVVFYKSGATPGNLINAKWEVNHAIRSEEFTIPAGAKYCKFLVVFRNESENSAISAIKRVQQPPYR